MAEYSYEIHYKPSFIRLFKKLDPQLQEEVEITIEKLKDSRNHQSLRVHKLSGRLRQFHSCSINYRERIFFEFQDNRIIVLLTVGNHDIYR
jgi:mRNA-degrading endonuclease YafQ of YafQ-DinJ toxin-antitoxin module